MSSPEGGDILTLEPLIEAIREGVEAEGWELSGLQKTTSHQFEGRWEGESTRSAYLFFHPSGGRPDVSVDVYLDETTRGLTGNLALVADLRPLHRIGDPEEVLRALGRLSAGVLDGGRRRPLTFRLRLSDAAENPKAAEVEVRFKVRIPRGAIRRGGEAVSGLAREVVVAFATLLDAPTLTELMPEPDSPEEE